MQAVRLGAVKLDEDFQQDDEEEQTVQQKQAELERPGHGGQRLEGMQGQDARGRQGRRPEARPEAAVQIDPGQQLQGQVAGLGRAAIDFSGKNDIQQEHAGEGKQQTLKTAKMPPAASVQQGEHGTSRSDGFSTGTCGSWPAGAADSGAAARGHGPVGAWHRRQGPDVAGHRSTADPKAEARDCKARSSDIFKPQLPCCGGRAPGTRADVSALP